MAKGYRGNTIKKDGWRGTCPICKKTGVKLLWTATDNEGKELNICKRCSKKQ
ncbi:MAG: hypothetical protein N4A68_15140 [Maledivibacter sp.]|jgi:hypothetical protein|nr:hypothetical protein [Maledivibacter sp.]